MKEMICINCPMGCHLVVDDSNPSDVKVSGNTCPRGKVYAVNEVTCPKRMVTSSVKVSNSASKMVSVKTREAIDKKLIFDCLKVLAGVTVQAPVHIGDVVVANVLNTGVDVVATKEIHKL